MNSYHKNVPNAAEFEAERLATIQRLGTRDRDSAIELLSGVIKDRFEYQWNWLGTPVIRMPEDLMVQQELLASGKYRGIIELGIARAGGLLFSASILRLIDSPAPVIGVDNIVHPHAYQAVEDSKLGSQIRIIEGSSISKETIRKIEQELPSVGGPLLILLDSDHSSEHVLEELRLYSKLCGKDSTIVVCDTLIDELGPGNFPGRSWDNGMGPLNAVNRFLDEENSWRRSEIHSRRGIISGIRDGVIQKI